MREKLRRFLQDVFPKTSLPFEIESPKVKEHGELSTNLALLLGKQEKKNPKAVADELVAMIRAKGWNLLEKVEVAGPGFINFTFFKNAWRDSLKEIESRGDSFGCSEVGKGQKVLVEFVSANPTGPVHIGNARGGPLGDAIASLFEATGYQVTREYYVNDVGGQIDKLGASILTAGWGVSLGEQQYQGVHVDQLAHEAKKSIGTAVDRLIQEKKETEAAGLLGKLGIELLLQEIRRTCDGMGIEFDSWVHEKEVLSEKTGNILQDLKKKGVTVEKEGALWLATQDEFLEDRECVLVRSDGRPTYFANDIAYHTGKYGRGYDRIIDIWGSNHHGHVPRIKAALQSLGYDATKIEVVLYQYVRIKRGNEAVKMSKRGGTFVTAEEVLEEVGRDAFRFFLLMRAAESHLDFDLDLAKKESQENPVYYVQYAHARLASLFRKAEEKGIGKIPADLDLSHLDLPEEIELIRLLHKFPDEVSRAASLLEPHRIPFYLLELSQAFQAYYAKAKLDFRYQVVGSDIDTTRVKLYLCRILKRTIANGLKLMGVSAPSEMRHD
ncbi:MAG: arginine--tRNA ligase [Deltaproteobacteria bacterium]|nr:arginine--tRNA ligase [Deltaproteobacteria bacterium]